MVVGAVVVGSGASSSGVVVTTGGAVVVVVGDWRVVVVGSATGSSGSSGDSDLAAVGSSPRVGRSSWRASGRRVVVVVAADLSWVGAAAVDSDVGLAGALPVVASACASRGRGVSGSPSGTSAAPTPATAAATTAPAADSRTSGENLRLAATTDSCSNTRTPWKDLEPKVGRPGYRRATARTGSVRAVVHAVVPFTAPCG
ncbi:hypothetical protein [Actinosynnema sp.]|uniref:hypothetical protein n=1 Tax=Actinosynnema sp. TaxID=1872144 RepID=UPI003F84843D